MIESLLHFVDRLGPWGYVVVFLIILFECQPALGLFMPGESIVLVGGFLASEGSFRLDFLILTIAGAAILGDSIGYELGRGLGKDWLLRHGRWAGIRESHLRRVDDFFARHGGKSAFVAHFMHLLRSLVPFVAGSSHMPYRTFFVFNALGCVAWAGIFATLGYLLGASWVLAEKWIGRASALLGVVVLLVLALVWLWRWLVRNEDDLKRRAHAFLVHPRVLGFRRRFAPQIRFLQKRLSPQGYLGLHLTAGGLIIIAAVWLFGGIVEDILAGDPLVMLDQQVANWFHAHATAAVTRIVVAITFLGSPAFLTGASLAVAALLAWRRRWHRLLAFVLTMGGGTLLLVLLKTIFHRPRPLFENPLFTLTTYSFPSGHVMGTTLFCGWLAFIAAVSWPAWRWRVLAVLAAFLFVLLIALTRMYLGLHFLSDVLGAMAAGLTWLAFCLTAVETFRKRPRKAS